MSKRLQDKRCLIVGGTSGIGLAAAQRFLQEGARVQLSGLDDALGPHAERILQSHGEVRFQACDATVEAEVESLLQGTRQFLGGIDVVYHVAGGSGRKWGDGALHECTLAGWQATLDVNLTSVFLTNRATVRTLLQQGTGGVILNMASILAMAPAPHHFDTSAYIASKGAIIALSRQTAARYASDRIRVNVLAPGLINTPMAARAINDPAILHYLRTKQPLCRGPGQPEDCSEAAVFLCSDDSRSITGTVMPVDAGWRLSEGQWLDRENNV